MILTKYLVIRAYKNRYKQWETKMDIREREPVLKGDEISVKLELEIPNALFERPKLEARVSVPPEAVGSPQITTKVTDNLEKLLKESTGLNLTLKLIEHENVEPKVGEDNKIEY